MTIPHYTPTERAALLAAIKLRRDRDPPSWPKDAHDDEYLRADREASAADERYQREREEL